MNSSAATESEIVNMSLRLAGMGATLGLSEAETLALAASMTELGIRSEQGKNGNFCPVAEKSAA